MLVVVDPLPRACEFPAEDGFRHVDSHPVEEIDRSPLYLKVVIEMIITLVQAIGAIEPANGELWQSRTSTTN